MAAEELTKKIQIYPSLSSSARQVTPFWKDKYERDAKKYWDVFYRKHKDKFFKDRHYFDKEWGHHFKTEEGETLAVLEVGCGAGNSIYPLVSTYPNIFVYACDFSPRAIDLVKAHKDFSLDRINPFVCDLTEQNLSDALPSSSVDIVTMVFVLSAIAPEKMPLVLQNILKVLKPNGKILIRDYATGDLAQERLMCKDQQISDNFFVRGDGTRAYYFSENFLIDLFTQNGFDTEEIRLCNKQVENRSRELVMNRRWIQAVFTRCSSNSNSTVKLNQCSNDDLCENSSNGVEIDVSDGIIKMFDVSPSIDEVIEIKVKGYDFKIKAVSREYQHTCKSTGLMLWESARLMCNILAENTKITSGKNVLELGCGSSGICSMVALPFANFVASTDGDEESLALLHENIQSNIESRWRHKSIIKKLYWGDGEDIKMMKELGKFEVIIGTDVTYNPEAINPLFETASELIEKNTNNALILCHLQRRVFEESIISAGSKFGFKLVDSWTNGIKSGGDIIGSWFFGSALTSDIKSTPLSILYFEI